LLVLGLILFHTARIFDLLPYYVKNEETSIVFMGLVGFVSQWGMPLLFFLAGTASWHSLGTRSPGQYVKERIKRLMVPFLFGICVIVPPARYYSLLANPDYDESFWQFYPKFFRVVFVSGFPQFFRADPSVGLFDTAHLWFLYHLFFFSLMALPVFIYLRSDGGQHFISRLLSICKRRGGILLLGLLVVLVELFVNLGESVGWNRYAFLSFLIYGYLFASQPGFEKLAGRDAIIALIAGIFAIAVFFLASILAREAEVDPSQGYAPESVLWRLFKGCSAWFWVVTIWGLSYRYKQSRTSRKQKIAASSKNSLPNNKVSRYSNEAVLPFYIIHEPVIVIIGFYVVKWQTILLAKYVVISLASFTITLLLYEIFIRRINVVRLLFGMRPKERFIKQSVGL
jgi:hypothetical protein